MNEGVSQALGRRRAALEALGAETFDLLVIGGGINGAGIARDAAMRGMRTALVERSDFASGTSSRSTKLIHGGLRYLEQGQIRLVLESVREREKMRTLAPHLVRAQEFIVPIFRDDPVGPLKLSAGLWAYDLLAGFWNVKRHRMLRRKAIEAAEPNLRRDGLRGAGAYWDYRTDDARLVLETALAAQDAGAVVVSYAEVIGFVKEGGRIVAAQVGDRVGSTRVTIRAHVVVNATGPWVDRVAALDEAAPPRLRLTKGVHLVVPRARIGHTSAIVMRAVADGRVMFVIPWGEQSLVGTTDTDHPGGPDVLPVVEASDISYLLDTVNHYFPAAHVVPGDVISAFAGVRPLVAPPPGETVNPSSVSREEEVFTSAAGLVTIAGGKLTTYRLIARSLVDRVVGMLSARGDRRSFGPCRTGDVPLPGGSAMPDTLAEAAISRDGHGLAPAVIHHLADRYGSRLAEVLGLVARDRTLASPIVNGLPDPRAEIAQAIEHEWALTVDDVLRRRTQLALREASGGVRIADEVASLMAPHLGWDPEATRAAAQGYVDAVREKRRRWQ